MEKPRTALKKRKSKNARRDVNKGEGKIRGEEKIELEKAKRMKTYNEGIQSFVQLILIFKSVNGTQVTMLGFVFNIFTIGF